MAKNNTLRTIRIGFLSTILALAVCIFMAASVSAHSAAAGHAIGKAAASGVTVNIVQKKGSYKFSPKSVTVKQGETATLCNQTSITQNITYQGFTIYTIAANTCTSQQVNFSPGTYVVHLKSNPRASLKIIVQ